MGFSIKKKKYCLWTMTTLLATTVVILSYHPTFTSQLTSHSTRASSTPTPLPEISFDGYDQDRVMKMFVNPSDFHSPFSTQTDYDGSKFKIGYVVPTDNLNQRTFMGANDGVEENALSTWFSVDASKNSIYIDASVTNDGNHATTINAANINTTTATTLDTYEGHGFEYYLTDIASGTSKITHGLSELGYCPKTTHNTQFISKIKNPDTTSAVDETILSMDKADTYHQQIASLTLNNTFTLKIGASYNYSLIKDQLAGIGTDFWFSSLFWNYQGVNLKNTDYAIDSLANVTHWSRTTGDVANQGLVLSLALNPSTNKTEVYSGTTTIVAPTINDKVTSKLETMLPSQAVDAMMSGNLPLFSQNNEQAFPGTIYGDSKYTLIPDDDKGCLTLKYTPGSLLSDGAIVDNSKQYQYQFYGFALSQLPPLNSPTVDSIDASDNPFNNASHVINVYHKPSDVTQSDMDTFIYNNIKGKVVQAPTGFNVSDLTVNYIPLDYEKRILISSITLKRIKVSTSDTTAKDINYNFSIPTNFYVYGFKTKPLVPDGVGEDIYKKQVWLDATPFGTVPQMLIDNLKNQDIQLLNINLINAIKNMLSIEGLYTWDDIHSEFLVTRINDFTNGANLDGSKAQINADITLSNLLNTKGERVTLDTQLCIYNCPSINDSQTSSLPENIAVSKLDVDFKTFTKNEFLSNGENMLKVYLTNLLNANRLDTSIPYAYLTNLVLQDVGANEVDATFDIHNYLAPNVGDANPKYELTELKGQKVHLTNFYEIPSIDPSIANNTTQFQLPSHEFDVSTSTIATVASYSNKFATDFIQNATTASQQLNRDFLQNQELMEIWYKNLPNDYFSRNSLPLVFENSLVADDSEGTLRFSYTLTYAKIDGENVLNKDGTILYNTVILKGFKNSKSLVKFPSVSTITGESFAQSNFESEFRNIFVDWMHNNILSSDNLSRTYKDKLSKLIQGNKYTISVTLLAFDKSTDDATFLISIPEISLVAPVLGNTFLEGFKHRMHYTIPYTPNTVTTTNKGHINYTYDYFAKNFKRFKVSDLIAINGKLPFSDEALTPSIVKLNAYDQNNHSAIIEFLFPVFYGNDTLLYNYLLSLEFTFDSDDTITSQHLFNETIALADINKVSFNNPFKNYTTAEIIYAYTNDQVHFESQINSWLNMPQVAAILFKQPQTIYPLVSCQNLIYQAPDSIALVISTSGGVAEKVVINGLKIAQKSVSTVIATLPTEVTFQNVANIFIKGDVLQNAAMAQKFITTAPLPTNASIIDAQTASVGYDKEGHKTAYLNIKYDKYFVEDTTVRVYQDVVVQVKLIFGDDDNLTQQEIANVIFHPQLLKDSASHDHAWLLPVVILSISLLIIISIICFIYVRKKHQGGH